MRNILITGGAGFVGRHFTKYFLENGDKVVVVDCIAPLTGGIDPINNWPFIDPRDYKNFFFIKEHTKVKKIWRKLKTEHSKGQTLSIIIDYCY